MMQLIVSQVRFRHVVARGLGNSLSRQSVFVALLAIVLAAPSSGWTNVPGQNGGAGASGTPGLGGHGSNHGAVDGSVNDGGNGGQPGQGAGASGGTRGGRGGDFGNLGVGGGGGGGINGAGGGNGGGGGGGGLGARVTSNNTTINSVVAGGRGGNGGNGANPASAFPGGGGSGGGGGAALWVNDDLVVTTAAAVTGGGGGNGASTTMNGGGGGAGAGVLLGSSAWINVDAIVSGGAGGHDGGGHGAGAGGHAIWSRPSPVGIVFVGTGSLHGGAGGNGMQGDAGPGGFAIRADSPAVVSIAAGRPVIAGNGGNGGLDSSPGKGGDGGSGVYVDGSSIVDPSIVINAGSVEGGHGGAGGNVCCGGSSSAGAGADGGHGMRIIHGTLTNQAGAWIIGGNAGMGGIRNSTSGGAPGAAGMGAWLSSGATASNLGQIRGGRGAEGLGAAVLASAGGAGIRLDAGVSFETTGAVRGGAGGSVVVEIAGQYSPPRNGGAAIAGLGTTMVTVGGVVEGGTPGAFIGSCVGCSNTAVRGDAVAFSGSGNNLVLVSGYQLIGNAVAGSGDRLTLGGNADASFDVGLIGAAGQYRGFGARWKSGTGEWTLTGSNASAAWRLVEGPLVVAGTAGAVEAVGGTLRGSGTAGAITLRSAATIAPGNGVGTLNGGSLTWDGGGFVDIQLGATSMASDRLALSGALARGSSGVYQFRFSDGASAPTLGTTYTLMTFASSSGFSVADFSYQYQGATAAFGGHFLLDATSLRFVATGQYSVGGTITGLDAAGLTLHLNAAQPLVVPSGSTQFTFPIALANGSAYAVTVAQSPLGRTCQVGNGAGVISGQNVTSVQVQCFVLTPQLALHIDNGTAHLQYGSITDYTVTLTNTGNVDATGVALSSAFSAGLVAGGVQWQCFGAGSGAQCSASGSGGFADSGIALPAGRSLTWVVSVPVHAQAPAGTVTTSVTATWSPITPRNASDTDTLVLFRHGFDSVPAGVAGDVCTHRDADYADMVVLDVPAADSDPGTATLLDVRSDHGDRVTLRYLGIAGAPWLRWEAASVEGDMTSSEWISVSVGECVAMAIIGDEASRILFTQGQRHSAQLHLPPSRAGDDVGRWSGWSIRGQCAPCRSEDRGN